MRLQGTLLSVLALAATLVSCSSDDTDSGNGGPASVKKLETPKNGLSVSMLLLDPAEFEGLRFEWQSAGDGVSYELAFDKNGGDFSAPVASFTTNATSHTLQLEELRQLFDENVDEAGESACLPHIVDTSHHRKRNSDVHIVHRDCHITSIQGDIVTVFLVRWCCQKPCHRLTEERHDRRKGNILMIRDIYLKSRL